MVEPKFLKIVYPALKYTSGSIVLAKTNLVFWSLIKTLCPSFKTTPSMDKPSILAPIPVTSTVVATSTSL